MSAVVEAPFRVLRVPRMRLSVPRVGLPPPMAVFGVVFFTFFVIVSGAIYDMINQPPSMGQERDARGIVRPVAFLKYRMNGQYVMEGIVAGMCYCMGALGFILLARAQNASSLTRNRYFFTMAGIALVALAYNLTVVFVRIKMPNYLR